MSIHVQNQIDALAKRVEALEETVRQLQSRVGWHPMEQDPSAEAMRKTLTLPEKRNSNATDATIEQGGVGDTMRLAAARKHGLA